MFVAFSSKSHHRDSLKEKEKEIGCLKSQAFLESRNASKTITSLRSDLSAAETQLELLTVEKTGDEEKAVREAKLKERHHFQGVVEKERKIIKRARKKLKRSEDEGQVRPVEHYVWIEM